jgi:N-succinyldiaminopimelate aminotransferase
MQRRPARMRDIVSIGVERIGDVADSSRADLLRLENLDVDLPPCEAAMERTRAAAGRDADNSYLPFAGQHRLREVVAHHVSRISGMTYDERHCVITPGGLAGILNVLLATIDTADEVIVTDPTYAGLLNRIRLAGGVPKFVPFEFASGAHWKLDRAALQAAIGPRTRAMLLMSPSMPSGGLLTEADWRLVAELCCAHDLLLIVDAAMERLVFDGHRAIHPAGLAGMRERTVTIGSASKELRMIGWRVGWIVGPEQYMPDIAAVSLANCVVPVGIAQDAAAIALEDSHASIGAYVSELERRRDVLVNELRGLPAGVPGGGWSLLLRVSDFGLDGARMSARLLEHGIAATGMAGWGERHWPQYIRFVFSNEPIHRLRGVGDKVRRALEG